MNDRLGETHRLQQHLVLRVTQRVTGGDVLQADHGVDVTCSGKADRVLLVGVHLEQLADALLGALGRVDDTSAGFDPTRVDADVGQPTEERVGDDLERERGERFVRRWLTNDLHGLIAHVVAHHRRHLDRRGQVGDDGIKHGLHALVLERRSAHHRIRHRVDGHVSNTGDQLFFSDLFATQVLFHHGVVLLGDLLHEDLAVFLGLGLKVRWDVLDGVVLTDGDLAAPRQRAHLDQVDDPDEVVLDADRQLNDQWAGT